MDGEGFAGTGADWDGGKKHGKHQHDTRPPHARGLDALNMVVAKAHAFDAAQAAAREELLAIEKEKLEVEKKKLALQQRAQEEHAAIEKAESEVRLKLQAEVTRCQEVKEERMLDLQQRQCELFALVLDEQRMRLLMIRFGEGGWQEEQDGARCGRVWSAGLRAR